MRRLLSEEIEDMEDDGQIKNKNSKGYLGLGLKIKLMPIR